MPSSFKNLTINDTGYIALPVGTTAQRPSASIGQTRYNSTFGFVEKYNNSRWQTNNIVPTGLSVWLDPSNTRSYTGTGTTWSDLSGNSVNATLTNGPVFTANNSFTLDGIDDYISVGSSLWSDNGDRTFSAWVYVNKLGSQWMIFDTSGTGDFSVINTGAIRVHPAASNYADTARKIKPQTWHHITLVQTSTSRTVYVNGEPWALSVSGGSPQTVAWNTSAGTLRIGIAGTYRNYLPGKIGAVQIYSRALTQEEIYRNYQVTKPAYVVQGDVDYGYFITNGLLMHYDFSNPNCYPGQGPFVNDLIGTQNGIVYGARFGGEGLQKYFDFERDRGSDYIRLGSSIPSNQSTSQLTMEAWIYTESVGTDIGAVISSQYDSVQNGSSISTDGRTNPHGGGTNSYHYQQGVNNTWTTTGSFGNTGANSCSPTSRWDHLVATRDSSGNKYVYENGYLLDQEGTFAGSLTWASTYWQIGAEPNGGSVRRFYDGRIAIVRIYNYCLSATEVLTNYNGQKFRFGLG